MPSVSPHKWIAAIGSGPLPRRTVAWLGGTFIATIVGLAILDVTRGYHAAVDSTARELDAQARLVAEQTARSVQATDVVLRHLVEQIQTGAIAARSRDELHAYLKQQAIGLVQIDGLVVVNADGSVRAVSLVPPERQPPINVASMAIFQRLKAQRTNGVAIESAARSPADGSWFFPIWRRLETPDGSFDGAVAARGRIGYFQDFYRKVLPDEHTRIALLHRNGSLMARHPPADAALGREVPQVADLLAAAASGIPMPSRIASPLDGVERFRAIHLVPDYPLAVVVSRDVWSALAPWRAQALRSGLNTLALATLAALLLGLAMRQFARLHAARESLEVSQERYALAAAGSNDGIWDWDLQAGTAYESRRARELQGLPLAPESQPLAELQAALTYHPDDAALRASAMRAHLDGHTPAYEVEYRIRHPDGVYRWIHVRALCIRDAHGKPLRLAGSVSDVDSRKRAEVALAESEDRFAVAVAGSDDGIWVWNYMSGRAYASARAREIVGMPDGPDEQSIDSWFAQMEQQVHPDDLQRRRQALDDHLAGRTPAYAVELRVRHGDGGYRWIRAHGMCVRDAEGHPQRIAGSVSDIDARKRAEEALRASEQRFALAVAGANDGILDWDIVNDRMFASERAMRMFGLEPDAVQRTRDEWAGLILPRFHPQDAHRLLSELRGTPHDPARSHDGEYRVRGADGAYRWMRFRGRSVRDAAGRSIRWAGSVSDIDGQKRTEEALRRSEERYQLAVEGSNEGLWDWDLASDMLFLSPRAQQLVSAEAGEPWRPRREWMALTAYHPDDVARLRRALADHLHGATPHFSIEFRLQHHSGQWRWYRQRGIALRDKEGRPYRMAGSMEDISVRKDAEAERERLEQQLRQAQKLEAIGTLAGGIAHDFNNILSAILGYGELVQKDAAEGTPLRRHIDASMSAAMRAKSLVERILAFSRSGMSERVPVQVQSVVQEALDGVAAALPHGVRLVRHLHADEAGVLGDATQIHQVVMNLCANAVHAMRSDGTLTVAVDDVTLDAPRAVATSELPAGRYVRLTVTDTGSGIAPAVLERIWDPFFTTKEVGVGTGLGLSLVHGITTDLGGGIAVRSELGHGSEFAVYLPWHSHVAATSAVVEDITRGEGETVLLVDDEEALVRLGEEMLAELGYEPVGFASSVAALEAFRAEPDRFDAVLSDESMPAMNGSELAVEIHRLRPDAPIVLMSGYVSPSLVACARDAGVSEVIAKPLRSGDIARSLSAALRSRACSA
ncbi:PAS domain-containing protein [Piscinibacter sp. XHJ-5]|uniref:PAS domain-containing protein n=1 Tax=Piscinibacter sp. XHJ-5 TaxID=3037797 RepID=UPI002453736C|nr:PAS domain-containing protein [Piscinibacter sp. XHJ-5]